MAYNHRYEQYKWEQWKAKEEKQLRELGVSEEIIQELREYDWVMLKKERTYYRWNISEEEILEQSSYLREPTLKTMQQLVDQLDNQSFYHALSELDKLTLQIIFYRVQKYTYEEIGQLTGMKKSSVSNRLYRLRKKLKKFLK